MKTKRRKREVRRERKLRRAEKRAWKRARPKSAPWVIPFLCAKDPRALAETYERAFGFEVLSFHPATGPAEHVELRHRRGSIMIGRPLSEAHLDVPNGTTTVASYVYVADVDALVARASAAGVRVLAPPQETARGDRVARVVDPEGHAWTFATHRRKRG